jgi:threonine synthase
MMNEKGIILKEPDLEQMRKDFFGISISDEETRKTIAESYKKYGLFLEPHGAVAWKGLESFRLQQGSDASGNQIFISLETAHPAKFGDGISLPQSLKDINNNTEEYIELENDYPKLRDYILKH